MEPNKQNPKSNYNSSSLSLITSNSTKIYIPKPQNRQYIQNINNIENQCNIYQIINSTNQQQEEKPNNQQLQSSQQQQQQQQSLDFLQTLLFISKSISMDSSATATTATAQPPSKPKNHHCNCKKTQCLKLYCECFLNNEECDDQCKCMDCCNTQAHSEKRNQAMENILQRNNSQQYSRFQNILNDQPKNYQRGCNCKKSGCQKKYCECYNAGVPCTEYCKCIGCENRVTSKKVKMEFDTDSIQPFNEELSSQQSQQSKNTNSDLHDKLLQFLQYADQLEAINQQQQEQQQQQQEQLV